MIKAYRKHILVFRISQNKALKSNLFRVSKVPKETVFPVSLKAYIHCDHKNSTAL